MKSLSIVLFALMFATVARAQETASSADPAECAGTVDPTAISYALPQEGAPDTVAPRAELTEAERRVQGIIREDGIHVVHFWAPWCSNSIAELEAGWYEVIEGNPDVSFTFVTVWNDGVSGREMLAEYAIPDRVVEVAQPDFGPSGDESQRRRAFLGLPLSWIPSTWIFRNNGQLAFALNYGEMSMETIQTLIDVTRADWSDD